jgi:hypothetical protein
MAINHKSGRVVVDLEAELKLALHAALASEGLSLKEWLSIAARQFIAERGQQRLDFSNEIGRDPGAMQRAAPPGVRATTGE